ncbi:hypothetical protein K458DRAFT_396542 [Lentithecium fluviatile CBS 122367]|uniref:RING-type domain-containing protein n=1 Tax=Lentithecium fluviatile CBS 122367 TaxID=1168545 RepID=A0A6G1IF05_9PLEO|nr:hypothetical protein K458DRAFT_396542 [Lentithecium fluviatile CBS 122367]
MPTLPILVGREAASQAYPSTGNHVEISATALGFLIPLFAVFIFGPIALVLFVRNRRGNRNVVGMRRYLFAVTGQSAERLSREEAKRVLEGVTEAVPCMEGGKEMSEKRKGGGEVTGMGIGEKEHENDHEHEHEHDHASDNTSVMERECAICLSPIYFPSPPVPAKLPLRLSVKATDPIDPRRPQATTTTTMTTTSRPPSLSTHSLAEAEEVLRLNVCSHEFHAECLTSWFVIGKFSCPICRAVYFGKGKEGKEEGSEGSAAAGVTEESEGSGIGRRREEV